MPILRFFFNTMSKLSRSYRGVFVSLIASFGLITLLSQCQSTSSIVSISGQTMGTSYSIKITGLPDTQTVSQLKIDIEQQLTNLNKTFSTYDNGSELSAVNRIPVGEWIVVSDQMFNVLEAASFIADKTDGAFDITVGPLVNLWGFGPEFRVDQLPADTDIQSKLTMVGYDNLQLKDGLLRKNKSVSIDLSAIAKGYAVDQLVEYLKRLGVKSCLVEIGGEIRAFGKKSVNMDWRIAVESPFFDRREQEMTLSLRDYAVATSGDYRNFFSKNGKQYSHTIDPKTGYPVDHQLASVTVLHESAMFADAWATAMMVLGVEKGFSLAESQQLAILFIERSGDQFVRHETKFFQDYLINN